MTTPIEEAVPDSSDEQMKEITRIVAAARRKAFNAGLGAAVEEVAEYNGGSFLVEVRKQVRAAILARKL